MANDIKTKIEPVTGEQVGKSLKQVAAVKEPVHKEKVGQLIYVGPNLIGLTKYTVVESIKVPHLQKFMSECPEVAKLIVPIAKMAEIETRMNQKGTLENRYLNKVLEYRGGAK